MAKQKMLNIKPVISVGAMAKALNHSRARFYQLQGTVYPPPLYDIRTRRPFYNAKLQQRCHEIRESGIGWDGNIILFYAPRQKSDTALPSRKMKRVDPVIQELTDTLRDMGLDTNLQQVQDAVSERFPDGVKDHGVAIRDLFRYLKK